MQDDGVDCLKHTYVPKTRAVLPWAHCHHDEIHYAFECIKKCKEGYKLYNAVALYYCGQKCPSGFTDAGLTCTKGTYGRGAGKLGVSVKEFVDIVGGVVATAFVFVALTFFTGGAASAADAAVISAAESVISESISSAATSAMWAALGALPDDGADAIIFVYNEW
jgi:hypothetical protein